MLPGKTLADGLRIITKDKDTNVMDWKEDEDHVTVEMVIENLHLNAANAKQIITTALPMIPAEPSWPSHQALKNAILTDRKCWPASVKRALAPLLKKYL